MNSVQILVLDFGSQYTQLIARRLREYGIYTEIVPYFESIDSIKAKNPKGIILSGGPASVYEEDAYKPDSGIFTLGVPLLGICYGMQYIAHYFGGKVIRAEAQEFGRAVLTILNKDSINANTAQIIMQTKHFIIQTYTIDDFEAFYELVSNKDTMQTLPTLSQKATKEWLDRQILNYRQYGYGIWAIIDKENGKMVGYAGFEKTKVSIKNAIQEGLQWSYVLDKAYQNKESCEAIARVCISYAFQNLYANEIYCLSHRDNSLTNNIAQTIGGICCDSINDIMVWKIANNSIDNVGQNNGKQLVGDTLILRELVASDLADIESMLLDCEVMSAWGRPLSKQEAKEWLAKQMQSYKLYGFGLFAVIEKSSGIMVGQCGITWQNVQDFELYNTIKSSITENDYSLTQNNMQTLIESKSPLLPELGYIFKKSHWHKGLASKAAQICMEYAFQTLGLPLLISLIRTDSVAPQNVAKRLEMRIVGKSYRTFDGMDMPHFVYMMRASDYLGLDFKSQDTKKVLLEFTSFTPNNPMQDSVKDEILEIWQNFINATYHFLTQKDIESMRGDINELLDSMNIIIASDYDKKLGFIGLQGNKIAALFISPSAFKKGVGKALLQKALESGLSDYGEILVDCNEANTDAISFYHTLGFEIFARSPKDLKNRDLPLVHFRASSALLMRSFNLHYNMPLFETERLIVREMRQSDKAQLQTMLLDYEVMSSWEYNFNDSSVQEWLSVQLNRYEKFGFGLWAVVDKDSGVMIGQAGLSLQTYNDKKVLGMTYIIAKNHWKKGYGAEVALGCKHYAFQVLKVKELYLLINESNEASKSVAKKLQAYLLGETTWTYRGRAMQRLVYRIKNTNTNQFILETSRTILRPYQDSDYYALKAMLQDKETMQAWNGVLSEQGVQEWIEDERINHDKFGIGWWVVVDRVSGAVIGQAGLHYTQYLEMNYMLHKDHWHKGYAIEIGFACKEYAFRHLRVKKLYSLCREDNIAAQNVAKRIGMDKVGIIEKDNVSYVEFCATSKVSPFAYTKYIYTASMESLETLQKNLGRLGLRIGALNTADSKEVLDLSALWQEHFKKTHSYITQEVVEQSGRNMLALLKQCKQCLIISCEQQGAVESEVLGFLVLHAMDNTHSFIEIFLCNQKACMQCEGVALLQALVHMNDSAYITVPSIVAQEQIQHFYTHLGFIKKSDSKDLLHFDGTLPSGIEANLCYKYHDTALPCFIYSIERATLSTSLRSLLLQDTQYANTESKQIFVYENAQLNAHKYRTRKNDIAILFEGVRQDSIVWMSHADKVERVPSGFVELARSGNTQNCAIADEARRIYALQFHPEVVHSECGGEILKNFALRICGADNSWNMKNFATQEIAKLRQQVLGDSCCGRDFGAESSVPDSSEGVQDRGAKAINEAINSGAKSSQNTCHTLAGNDKDSQNSAESNKQKTSLDSMKVLETARTYLRTYTMQDLEALQAILDSKTMYAWGHGFTKQECKEWIETQLERYRKYGFGLWAVVDKASGQIIGSAGLNYERIDMAGEREILELGYIINHRFWGRGYGLEVAVACARYAFERLGAKELYCLIKWDNLASLKLARKLGMRVVGENSKIYQGQKLAHYVLKAGELVLCVDNAGLLDSKIMESSKKPQGEGYSRCGRGFSAESNAVDSQAMDCHANALARNEKALRDSKISSAAESSEGAKSERDSKGCDDFEVGENSKICDVAKDVVNAYAAGLEMRKQGEDAVSLVNRGFQAEGEIDSKVGENSKICGEKTSQRRSFFSKSGLSSTQAGSCLDGNDCRDSEQSANASAAGFCDDFKGCADFGARSLVSLNDEATKSNSLKSAQKPTHKVLCAVSGGVDSSVVATLLHRAIGENLIPVFVDTGLLRKGEKEAVIAMFRENLKVPLIVVDSSALFLGRLKGVTDPERKRKIIGETFIEVFEAEASKHKGEIKYLAQGTLYPDVIESVSVKGPSKTIKSHHNVGGLPEWMKFELIEPLRELFKDEVRALGRELGMPESMLMRHPFPGPGLAIRIMGEVNEGDLELLREADSIFIEELHRAGLYDRVWQAFCVLLNVRSVGVMGDNRTYDNTICLRAVDAQDGMTASFSTLPHEFLESVSNRIINEVAGINRVVYDITSKPPGTIEWE